MGPRERITRRQKNTSRLLRQRKQVQKDKIKIKTFKKKSAGRSYVGTFLFILALVLVLISGWRFIKMTQHLYEGIIDGRRGKSRKVERVSGFENIDPKMALALRKKDGPGQKISDFLNQWKLKLRIYSLKSDATKEANEEETAKLLKKYAAAQEVFRQHNGFYARWATELILSEEGTLKIIDSDLSAINYSYDQDRPTNGYYFVYIDEAKGSGLDRKTDFFLCAVPIAYGYSGVNTLCINPSGVVLKKDNQGKAINSPTDIDTSWNEFKMEDL